MPSQTGGGHPVRPLPFCALLLSLALPAAARPNGLPAPTVPACLGVTLRPGGLIGADWPGAGLVRIPVALADIEKSPSVDDFSALDALLSQASVVQARPVLRLAARGPEAERFVGLMTAHFAHSPAIWELDAPLSSVPGLVNRIRQMLPDSTILCDLPESPTADARQALNRSGLLALPDGFVTSPGGLAAWRRWLDSTPSGRTVDLAAASDLTHASDTPARRALSDIAQGARLSFLTLGEAPAPSLANLTKTLDGYRFVKAIPLASEKDSLLLFSAGEHTFRLAGWTAGAAHAVSLPLPDTTPVVLGNGERPLPKAGRWAMPLTAEPAFALAGDDPGLRLAAAWSAEAVNPSPAFGAPLQLAFTYRNNDAKAHRVRFLTVLTDSRTGLRQPVINGEDIVPASSLLRHGAISGVRWRGPVRARVGLQWDGVTQAYPQDVWFRPQPPAPARKPKG